MSQTQIIIILKFFKEFFAWKIVLAANHHYPEIIQKFFPLQNCLRSKSSLSWNYSDNFSPAKFSYLQIIIILEIFKDFFACKTVLDAIHHYPEIIQRLFRLKNCLRRKSSLIRKYSMTFSPAKWSLPQIIFILETFKDFSPAKLSSTQITIILKTFKKFSPAKLS